MSLTRSCIFTANRLLFVKGRSPFVSRSTSFIQKELGELGIPKRIKIMASTADEMASAANDGTCPRITKTLFEIASDVVELLRAATVAEEPETLGVAESLTGGGIMAAITSVPGASAVFRGGVVSYATELKQELLGVDADLIARESVIHADVADQMANGVRRITTVKGAIPTTWGVATTGVAGPDIQDGKPAGTVFIGIAWPGGSEVFGPFKFAGSREQVREATVLEALERLRDMIVKIPHFTL
jgi:PncC family amidohydrolase